MVCRTRRSRKFTQVVTTFMKFGSINGSMAAAFANRAGKASVVRGAHARMVIAFSGEDARLTIISMSCRM